MQVSWQIYTIHGTKAEQQPGKQINTGLVCFPSSSAWCAVMKKSGIFHLVNQTLRAMLPSPHHGCLQMPI